MLDRKFVLANQALIERNIADRRSRPVDVREFAQLEQDRLNKEQQLQQLRHEAKNVSKQRTPDAIEHGRELRAQERELRDEVATLQARADELLAGIPNLTHPSTPIGGEEDGKVIAHGAATPRVVDFPIKDHVDLATDMGILDLTAGSRVAGAGFYFLQGEGVMLELALQRMALDRAMAAGYSPQIVPELARDEILAGTGYTPRGDEANTYHIEGDDLNLIATSEIVLCGRYADQVLNEADLPLKLCGISNCYRTERAYGRATRGLYRVHQFSKVEMVIICHPDDSEQFHDELLTIERGIFDDLEIPYHVIDIASGDLGAPAYRKFDIEAWMPGRGDGGEYAEVTSASTCTDYQARRLGIRYRGEDGKRHLVHTLNGTSLAVGRAMIAVLENYQNSDGTVTVPEVLRPYLGGLETITGTTLRT
ncbi:serine--tRNA ligase [Nocardia brevicatena]|uniref:serine--tRNA ligase n=1 Tax=Nocardia brevicatena TaxID=37327 RepID=UPI00031E75A2|nr:serine--tRNA ligase [Nocardia brevicatena]